MTEKKNTTTKTTAKTATPKKAKYELFGHSVCSVIRYMGTVGHTKPTAMEVLTSLRQDGELNEIPRDTTVGLALGHGRNGKGSIPELTAAQKKMVAAPEAVKVDLTKAVAEAEKAAPKKAAPKKAAPKIEDPRQVGANGQTVGTSSAKRTPKARKAASEKFVADVIAIVS